MPQPPAMRSTCARAIEVAVSPTTSKVSQSPSQKSNCRYSGAGHLDVEAGGTVGPGATAATARQHKSGTLSMATSLRGGASELIRFRGPKQRWRPSGMPIRKVAPRLGLELPSLGKATALD